MSRGVHAIKQGDVAKVFKAARIAGLVIERYEIDKAGKIVVIPHKADAAAVANDISGE